MIITAHGGANKTGRNTWKYLNNIDSYECDAIEIDIYRFMGKLIISHLPPLIPFIKRITVEQVFDIVAEKGIIVNCDLKMNGLKEEVEEIAKKKNILDKVYFTGYCTMKDNLKAKECKIWFNNGICGLVAKVDNVSKIVDKIKSYNNPCFAGLNINKRYATDEFLRECKKQGLQLSIYTVDKESELARLVPYDVFNITTNCPNIARNYVGLTHEEALNLFNLRHKKIN